MVREFPRPKPSASLGNKKKFYDKNSPQLIVFYLRKTLEKKTRKIVAEFESPSIESESPPQDIGLNWGNNLHM